MITITNEAKFHGIEVKAHKLGLLLLYNNYYVNNKKEDYIHTEILPFMSPPIASSSLLSVSGSA